MINLRQRNNIRQTVHSRIRAKMSGTAERRASMCTVRSTTFIRSSSTTRNGVTLASASTMTSKSTERKAGGNVEAAKAVGK